MDDSRAEPLAEQATNTPPRQDNSDSKNPESPSLPVLIPKVPPTTEHQRKSKHRCKPDQTPAWKIFLEVGAFALGLVFAWIYRGQLNAMQGQLAQMRQDAQESSKQFQAQLRHFDAGLGRTDMLAIHAGEQTVASQNFADAAKTQAGTARKSLQATIENFHQEQRAWIGVGNPTFEFGENQPIKETVHIVDTGHSPARKVVTRMGFVIFPHGHMLVESDLVLHSQDDPIYTGVVFPTSNVPLSTTTQQSIPSLDPYKMGKLDIYAFGTIDYEDIFKKPHWTTYCYQILPTLTDVNSCQVHNESSDDQTK